jgi:hypothetical protein
MPGWVAGLGGAAGQRGGRGERPGIITGVRGRRAGGRAAGSGHVRLQPG